MEIELKNIDFDANVYDIYEALERIVHGPELHRPNDRKTRGRKTRFEVVLGVSPAGRIHNGTAILLVPVWIGKRLLRWFWDSPENVITVKDRALLLFNGFGEVPPEVVYRLEKAFYVNPCIELRRRRLEDTASRFRLRIAKVQFGVWFTESDPLPKRGRTFSVEYEREYLTQSAAYINLVYKDSLICIDIGQRETEEMNYQIRVKHSSIRIMGIGWDVFREPYIIFDLHTPPNFEQGSYNNCVPEGVRRKSAHKTRDRISALDDAHASIAPYAHQLRVMLANSDDLRNFEAICHHVECEPLPIRIPHRVDALAMRFFRKDFIDIVSHWIAAMDWRNAFQIEAYLRCGLLNTYDLIVSLQKPIEDVIRDYASQASDLLRQFAVALRTRTPKETPAACLARVRTEYPVIKPLRFAPGHILCHHVIITPSRILPDGPYTTQSNRVIRKYQNRNPRLVEHFVRVEFRDEDRLTYRWDGKVDGTWFLQRRVGGILREGFQLGGRTFEFLAYSQSSLREHAVWFVSPFEDPVEGFVDAEHIRASLGDFSQLRRTPSKYAARIAQAFTATDPSVTIRRDQWEEHADIGPHTDGVGTISPKLADMIWKEKCRVDGDLRENCIKPSVFQFRFLGYKGVVVVDSRLQGFKMRLRESQRKFPVYDDEHAEFEIARSFDYPNPVHLNRPAVMTLEDLGVRKQAFMDLQGEAKRRIYLAGDSLPMFAGLLKSHGLGDKFRLAFVLEQLFKVGLDFKDHFHKEEIGSAFLGRLVRDSMNHSLREVKFKARIPVPHSYQLVGVADEGQAYIKEGEDPAKVFTLKEKEIYVCVQEAADKEPVYFKGICVISRSPVIHPGDVQRVFAVGEPPDDKVCFFRGLKNVVVLPAIGVRSLASCLAGGDLDGDTYDVYFGNEALIFSRDNPPAACSPAEVWTLDESRGDATVEDVCDFIVEYINSDVMGLLAHRHIVIADQSEDGVFDERCLKLAGLCSKAVDYAKNGKPVELRGNLPRTLIKFKPDWDKAEVTGARNLDYYESDRALGDLFRAIQLYDPHEPLKGFPIISPRAPLCDPISLALGPLVRYTAMAGPDCEGTATVGRDTQVDPDALHAHYVREMRYICATHTLVDAPDVRLMEEEVVLGTILANCTQPRLRKDRASRLKLQSETLVRDIRSHLIASAPGRDPSSSSSSGPLTELQLRDGLRDAWAMWCWAQHHRKAEFVESFALIALGVVLDCLKRLGALPDVD